MEDFKKDAISQIVNSLIKREPFVTQIKFSKFEMDINLSIISLPSLNDIKNLLTDQTTQPPSMTRKVRRLKNSEKGDISSQKIDEDMAYPASPPRLRSQQE